MDQLSAHHMDRNASMTIPEHEDASKPRLLDQVRNSIRCKHYSIRTEQSYIDWIKRYIFFLWPQTTVGINIAVRPIARSTVRANPAAESFFSSRNRFVPVYLAPTLVVPPPNDCRFSQIALPG